MQFFKGARIEESPYEKKKKKKDMMEIVRWFLDKNNKLPEKFRDIHNFTIDSRRSCQLIKW